MLVSSVTLSANLPWIFVSLPSGLLIDRYERRRVMGLACIGATLLLLAFSGALAGGTDSIALLDLAAFR